MKRTDAEMLDYLHSQLTPRTEGGNVPMRDQDVAEYVIPVNVWDQLEAHIGQMQWEAEKERDLTMGGKI